MPRGRPRKNVTVTVEDAKPKIICIGCGCDNQKNFYQARDDNRKFFGKVPYCKDCIQKIFQNYLRKYAENYNLALYYTLRKIDLPYIHSAYTGALQNVTNPDAKIQGLDNILSAYMKSMAFAEQNGWGSTFDDSMGEDQIDGLSSYDDVIKVKRKINRGSTNIQDFDIIEMDADELVQKWGRFDDDDLAYLESEYMDWEEQLNGIVDKFVDIMVKQVCLQMNEIRHDRENGVPVEKKLAALRNLIKDSGLADLQNNEAASQGVGMTARDIEFHRPVREPDKELNDVDNIGEILIGFLGGTSRAIGKENEFTEVFDKVYDKYTIDIIDNLRHQYGLDFGRQGGDSDAQSHNNDKTQEESIEVKD